MAFRTRQVISSEYRHLVFTPAKQVTAELAPQVAERTVERDTVRIKVDMYSEIRLSFCHINILGIGAEKLTPVS